MKRLIYDNHNEFDIYDDILCMSDVLGKEIKPNKQPFSFYLSRRNGNKHDIRVKVMFNAERLNEKLVGILELHGYWKDWKFTPGENDKTVKPKQKLQMLRYFREHLMLIILVWDEHLSDSDVAQYFRGKLSFHELRDSIDFYDLYYDELKRVNNEVGLERFCRKHTEIVSLHGN